MYVTHAQRPAPVAPVASRFLPPVRAPAQHPSEPRTNRAIVLAPFYAYPLVQIGGTAAAKAITGSLNTLLGDAILTVQPNMPR